MLGLTRRKFITTLFIYLSISFIGIMVALKIGAEKLNFLEIFKALFSNVQGDDVRIFYRQRLPRVIMAFIAGGTLGITGLSFQIVFRNSLATPFTIGITSGGTLGAVLALSFGIFNFNIGPFSSVQVFSLIGSLLVLGLIFVLTLRKKEEKMNVILLTGVSIGIVISALILLVRYLLSPNLLIVVDRWMLGGLSIGGYKDFAGIFPFLLPGLGLMFFQSVKMNYLFSGRDMALSRGVDYDTVTKALLIGGSIATASVVSVVGPIAFIGLIVPHIVRRISGSDTRILMPAVFFIGGAFLTICDAISRIIIAPSELPVGVITAVLGGGYFLYLINCKARR